MYLYTGIFGAPFISFLNIMWIPMNTIQIKACDQEVHVAIEKKRRGYYWSYEHLNKFYGPFKGKEDCLTDARTYSRYGTTNKQLISST